MSNQLLVRRRESAIKKGLDYLKFKADEDNCVVTLNKVGEVPGASFEISKNGGEFVSYTCGTAVTLNTNESIKFRKAGDDVITTLFVNGSNYCRFATTGSIRCSGNIMSLLDASCQSLTVGKNCFYFMFSKCTITTPPKLPATTLGIACYYYMFDRCRSLLYGAELPAYKIYNESYSYMYSGCVSLISHPSIVTDSSIAASRGMFQDCIALRELPYCSYVANLMFDSCRSMPYYHVFATTSGMGAFSNNISCRYIIFDSIVSQNYVNSNSFIGLPADCKFYVPYSADHSILNAYKAAQYWSDRADYIFELDENGEIPS